MNPIWRVSTGNTEIIGRHSDGTYHASDYLYALPQAFRYTQSPANGAVPLRFSTVSLSRTGTSLSLAVAEWGHNADAAGKRLARFDFATDTMLAADADGIVRADAVYTILQRDTQGTALVHDKYYLSRNDGANARGNLGVFPRRIGDVAERLFGGRRRRGQDVLAGQGPTMVAARGPRQTPRLLHPAQLSGRNRRHGERLHR